MGFSPYLGGLWFFLVCAFRGLCFVVVVLLVVVVGSCSTTKGMVLHTVL